VTLVSFDVHLSLSVYKSKEWLDCQNGETSFAEGRLCVPEWVSVVFQTNRVVKMN